MASETETAVDALQSTEETAEKLPEEAPPAVPAKPAESRRCDSCGLAGHAGRLHGQRFQCNCCLGVSKAVRRTLGKFLEKFQLLEGTEKEAFFKDLSEKRRAQGTRNMAWSAIRGALQHVTENSTQVTGTFLPLNVWLAQGWEESQVTNSEQEWDEEKQCYTYRVDVKKLKWKEALGGAPAAGKRGCRERTAQPLRTATSARRRGRRREGRGAGAGGTQREVPRPRAESAARSYAATL